MTLNDLLIILPTAILVAWAILLLLVDLWFGKSHRGLTALLAAIGLAVSLGVSLALNGINGALQLAFHNMVVWDGFAVFANLLILGSGLLGVALAYDYLRRTGIDRGEYYVLLLISTAGMMLMVQAYDLVVFFLALELLSIPLYVLAGFARPQAQSEEAALKYFLLGAFASAVFLYGAALVYGASGTTSLLVIARAAQEGSLNNPGLLLAGAALLLVGLGFKVSAVPFHTWTPDVYQGAPSPVTAWMSVTVKVAGVAALFRLFLIAFPGFSADLRPVLWGLSAITMVVGNLLAIVQNNVKRLLAYSSIAQVGYLLMALVPYGDGDVAGDAIATILFYLLGYALTSFTAWGVVIAAEKNEGKGLELDDYAGLGRKYPWLGVAMGIAMFSFIGIPLTLGFWGKFYIFQAVIQSGGIWLALVGILTSLFSAYYYLRVLVVMFMRPGEPEARQESWLGLVTVISALAVVLLAFVPGALFNAATQAVLHIP
jgi:NADH-quinone oxidoreductase subunit N